ncbi:MAG: metallophosphoesterase [Mucilaginibacter sp.]|nr:metallophosphoesterase [Mucilaginibacter sp.]
MTSESQNKIRFLHLSDLHFAPNLSSPNNCLSVEQLIGIEKKINQLKSLDSTFHFNKVFITGDVSHDGTVDSMVRARSWIFSQLEVNEGRRTGLNLGINKDLIKIIPGNHDANFNIPPLGTPAERWAKIGESYKLEFKELETMSDNKPYFYDWIDIGDENGIFMMFVDTSFLSDSEQEKAAGFSDQIKKRLVNQVVSSIHSIFNLGINGQLSIPGTTEMISAKKYKNSLKIFLSHHYLLQPAGDTSEFLKADDRRSFLNKVCLADFDIILNGHRHQPSFFEGSFADNFDERGKIRYIYKQLRYLLGFQNLPTQLYNPSNGQLVTRNASVVMRLIKNIFQGMYPDKPQKSIIELLNTAADTNRIDDLENLIKTYLTIDDGSGIVNIYDEDNELRSYLQTLNSEQRASLNRKSDQLIKKILTFLKRKSILAINGGSATIEANMERRSFNIYEVVPSATEYKFFTMCYKWNQNGGEFQLDYTRERSFKTNELLSMDIFQSP